MIQKLRQEFTRQMWMGKEVSVQGCYIEGDRPDMLTSSSLKQRVEVFLRVGVWALQAMYVHKLALTKGKLNSLVSSWQVV